MHELKGSHDQNTRDTAGVPTSRTHSINSASAHPDAVTTTPRRLLRVVGGVGVAMTVPVLAWLMLGVLDSVPSMVDVFGIPGLRIPASITVCGLLMAAIGFHKN
jgi:hypothetical protein